MTIFPIHTETLKNLYANGHITAAALTAIAPITWLAQNYPELLKESEKAVKAIAPESKTCDRCIYFSSVHSCCTTRIDTELTYLAVAKRSPACQDFEGVELPEFMNGEQQ